MELKTLEEWDAEIKQHSLHLKYDSQLFFLEESIEAKIPRINRALMEILFFPDAKKKEICWKYIESGEITNYFDMETPVPILLEDQARIDAEYQHELNSYTTKLARLRDKLTCCQKEMELRADSLVARKPKGTDYYVDFDNGHDVNNDGTTSTKSNADGPWATLDKCGSTLTAGDKAIVRRSMTQTVTQDLAFTNDGTIVTPITIEADYGDAWSDFVDLSATGTATLTFGSKTVTFSADISGVLAAGDWIYVSGDAAKDFAYEVATVSTVTVTLYLPYKGGQAGSGKTVYNMGDAPIWNTAAGDYQVYPNGDDFWKLQGLHLRGTDSNGVLYVYNSDDFIGKDLILEGNGAGDIGVKSYSKSFGLLKTRGYNYLWGMYPSYSAIIAKDCLFDGNSVASSYGYYIATTYAPTGEFYDCEFKNHASGDIRVYIGTKIIGRNNLFSSATEFPLHSTNANSEIMMEDYDQTLGDNRQLTYFSTAAGTPSIQSETTEVRAGGGASSIKVTPSDKLASTWELSRILLFEYPIYAVKDVAKTYTVYLKSSGTGNWTADPLATELWVEAEYWGHATNVARKILKSTGVCDFNGDDTNWLTLTVTVTPLQTGVLYLRGYYCKTKEAGKSNIFYCDTVIGVA